MPKNWNILSPPSTEQAQAFARELGVSPIIATILLQRGISTPTQAYTFLHPSLDDLLDPFLMLGMEQAVDRLIRATSHNEHILIYGDYDVDGTTAVSLVYLALLQHHPDHAPYLHYYTPDRFSEGYGISRQALSYAYQNGIKLIIALDCGIKANQRIAEARSMGIDIIICDHHLAGPTLPQATAILDPKQPDCPYPDKNLSGCGVGFKLMTAYYTRMKYDPRDLIGLLDLVVVSIASDIVPIIGENRILAYYGLQQLNSAPHVGLQSIMATAGLQQGHIGISDIIFKIGPRLNAAGRMKNADDAVRLLISSDRLEADTISRQIDDSNNQRKDLDREITRQAVSLVSGSSKLSGSSSIVTYQPTWSKGVIGIVASRLAEMYHRPTIILTQSPSDPLLATGSARSVGGFDLYKAIDECSYILDSFGGHTYAAGLTLKIQNVGLFQQTFEAYASEHISSEEEEESPLEMEEINLNMITDEFTAQLQQFEPFGPLNPKPIFATRGVYDYGTSKTFGRKAQNLLLDIIGQNERDVKTAIGFGFGHLMPEISNGQPFDICYTIDQNDHRGKRSTILTLKDIHIQEK